MDAPFPRDPALDLGLRSADVDLDLTWFKSDGVNSSYSGLERYLPVRRPILETPHDSAGSSFVLCGVMDRSGDLVLHHGTWGSVQPAGADLFDRPDRRGLM